MPAQSITIVYCVGSERRVKHGCRVCEVELMCDTGQDVFQGK